MRPHLIVFLPVVADHDPRFRQVPQLFPVQALIPEATVKTLHKTVLPRAAWLNVDRLDPIILKPPLDNLQHNRMISFGLKIKTPSSSIQTPSNKRAGQHQVLPRQTNSLFLTNYA